MAANRVNGHHPNSEKLHLNRKPGTWLIGLLPLGLGKDNDFWSKPHPDDETTLERKPITESASVTFVQLVNQAQSTQGKP